MKAADLFLEVERSRRLDDAILPHPSLSGVCRRGTVILRVWRVDEGWALVVESVARMSRGHWVSRVNEQRGLDGPQMVEADLDGQIFAPNEGQGRGFQDVLPLAAASWTPRTLRLDCKHGSGSVTSTDIAAALFAPRRSSRRGISHKFDVP